MNDSTTAIEAEILRIRARWLKRLDDVAEGGWGQAIVDVLVETLEAHARVLLPQVEDEQSAKKYIENLRRVGNALFENAEQRNVLADPHNDARLRRIAASSIDFILRKAALSPAQQEQFINERVARIREDFRPKADKWQAQKAAIVYELDVRFEAAYSHWAAEALDRVRALTASATRTDAGGLGDGVAESAGKRATSWQDIQISFLSDTRVQIQEGSRTQPLNYAELGFRDRRSGKPNRAWIVLRALAENEGILLGAKATSVAWTLIERRVQEIRKALRTKFGLPGDPLPFVPGTGYQAVFKISCAASYES